MPDPLVDERPDIDAPAAPQVAERGRQGLDPLTKRLVMVSAVLVVAILVTTGAIVYFASAGTKVPRTAVERDVIVARQEVEKKPNDVNAWVALVSAEINAGKYDEAEAAIKGLEQVTKRSVVMLVKGDLAAARGDVSGARGWYTKAAAQAKKDHQADIAEAVKNGVNARSVPPSRPEMEAYLALGRLDMQAKDYGAAVKHLQAALQLDPNAADGLVMLGDAQVAAGKKDAARASYKKALTFVPDYAPALDGLKSLEGGK